MNHFAVSMFRARLKWLHQDLRKIRRTLDKAKKSPVIGEINSLEDMILEADKELLEIKKDIKEQVMREKSLAWYRSLGDPTLKTSAES